MEVKLILEKTATGYSAYSDALPGMVTAGETIDEVKENFKEVVALQLAYLQEQNKVKEAEELKNIDLHYYLDLNTFFDYYSLFNKTQLAKYLGINSSLLRRLSSHKVELSEKKAIQIQEGLHKLADELKEYHFT